MGNTQELKLVVVGLQNSGKSSFCNLLSPKERTVEMDTFRNFRWRYTEKLYFDVWDLSGRLPHLWNHQMARVDGIVFVISQKLADTEPEYLPRAVKEILNLVVNYFTVPITFIINQCEKHQIKTKLNHKWFSQEVFSVADKKKENFYVFELDLKSLAQKVQEDVHTSKQLAL